MKPLKPSEIMDVSIQTSIEKGNGSLLKLAILSVLAGAFIAFAAEGSNMAAFNLFADPNTYGLGKALAVVVFGTGLMLVVLAGGELFTGNTLIVAAILDKKVTMVKMLRNWTIVYAGNLIGSLLIAYMMVGSGLLSSGGDMLGAVTVNIAVYKVNLSFLQAFYLGIMCNWLVCLAIWISYGAESMVGKIFAIFFPIWLFITSGFEHSVANMYYIPAGILAKANTNFTDILNLPQEVLDSLTWKSFFINNLIPVTLGNIVGGSIMVAGAYWLAYKKSNSLK
jgi:formate/nitrite transporter